MTYQEKLNSLTDSSIWVFTKQTTDFDDAFNAVRLFNEIPNRENVNIEKYFEQNYNRYDISTSNHRMLVIPQLFGLLTKTPFYKRGTPYKNEKPTEMFDLLNKCEFGSKEYNTLKTEQILKIKFKAVVDTAGNNEGYNVLPIIFCYKVLRQLKEQHDITAVNLDVFHTYAMTCSSYSEVDLAVKFICENAPACRYAAKYQDKCRIRALLSNINLFVISDGHISLNGNYNDYFTDNFMDRFDIDELNIQLSRDVDYTYFLTTYQGFDVNLIDGDRTKNINLADTPKARKKKVVKDTTGNIEDDDTDYVEKVDDVKEYNINVNIVKDAFKNKPSSVAVGILKRYSKNPLIGKVAINKADYKCENNNLHETFISSHTRQQFMEAHHLIPINQQAIIWERYGVNIDCVENIVSLCPNCHRAIHYAVNEIKRKLIEKLYNIKRNELSEIGLNISLDELFDIYGV